MQRLIRFIADERGATAVEYGLIVAILSAALVATFQGVQSGLNGTYSTIVAALLTAN